MVVFPITNVTRVNGHADAGLVGVAQQVLDLLPTQLLHTHNNKVLLDKLVSNPYIEGEVVTAITPQQDPAW